MLPANRRLALDACSTSGRSGCAPVPWAAPQRWCKRPSHCLKAAYPAAFPSNGTTPLPLPPAFPSSLDSSQQQQLQPQQPEQQQQQLKQRPRRLFGGPSDNGNGQQQDAADFAQQQQQPGNSSSSTSGLQDSRHEQQQQQQPNAAAAVREQLGSDAASGSSFASISSADSDSEDGSSQAYGHNRSNSSSSSSSRRSISADYAQQLQQQPQHPRSFLLKGQQQQEDQEQQQQQQQRQQQLMHQQRSLRTVQWYREQANRRLTYRIQRAPDLAGLRQLMRQYEGAMNQIHVNALFGRLVKLVGCGNVRPLDMLALPSLLPQVLTLVVAAAPSFDERAISNCLHGLAVLELAQEREVIGALLGAAESVGLAAFTPQGLANSAWALATLRVNPGPRLTAQLLQSSGAAMRKFKPVELAQLGWGLAVLRVRAPEPWVAAWRGAVAAVIDKLNPQGVSMVLWAAARIWEHQEHSALQQLWLSQQQGISQQQLPRASSPLQQQGAVAAVQGSWTDTGAAAAGPPAGWMAAAEAAIRRQLHQYTPHSLSICLWAFAKLGHRPADSFTAKALKAVQGQLCTASCRPADLAVLLYSCAALHFRPCRQWMDVHGAALLQRARSLSMRETANVLWAMGRLGAAPNDPDVLRLLMKQLYYGMQDANGRDLASSLWALASIGHKPDKAWMGIFGAQAEALVHEFTPQEIANLLWAYAKLGMKPPHMLLVALWESVGGSSSSSSAAASSSLSPTSSTFGAFSAASGTGAAAADGFGGGSSGSSGGVTARLSAFKPGELAMLLWALASLQVVPGKLWWEQFLQASYHKMTSQSPQSLATIIWSLSELQLQPPPAWLYHWAAATRGALPQMSPIDLGQVAAALQGLTFEPLGLPKLETLLLDVLDRLAAVELQSGAYSRAAVELLMRMPQQQQQQRQAAKDAHGSSSSSSSSQYVQLGSNFSSSGSSSGGRERRKRSTATPAEETAAAAAAAAASADSSSAGVPAASAASADPEVEALKQQLLLQVQQQQPVATTAELFAPDLDSLGVLGAFDMAVVSSDDGRSSNNSKAAPAAAV
uniref:FAST kinase leucine-rich domain-containing protein n=1 Tax=Tetradesmus obliquus TaxID=3088 RepID=A0A383VCV1_TETOB|eukprot:jgi/Sobl393_1/8447/SZX63388.1